MRWVCRASADCPCLRTGSLQMAATRCQPSSPHGCLTPEEEGRKYEEEDGGSGFSKTARIWAVQVSGNAGFPLVCDSSGRGQHGSRMCLPSSAENRESWGFGHSPANAIRIHSNPQRSEPS